MALVRCVTEMGMGVDVHGRITPQRPSEPSSTPSIIAVLGSSGCWARAPMTCASMSPLACPIPERWTRLRCCRSCLTALGHCEAVAGGLEVPNESGDDALVIANAVVIVSYDDGK